MPVVSVCLLWQEPQTVWINCPRDNIKQGKILFAVFFGMKHRITCVLYCGTLEILFMLSSVFAASRLREAVSNRSRSLFNEVKDYGSETKSQNPCGRGISVLLPYSCVF